jgi:UDP-3-O-[3-hydroxymyristoyl] glucosamine N-acyltransferase
MGNKINLSISTHSLGRNLGLEVVGPDLPISSVAPLSGIVEGCLCFSKRPLISPIQEPVTVICSEVNNENIGRAGIIISRNPRLDFARALAWIDVREGFQRPDTSAVIHPTAKIGRNVVFGKGVTVGANTIIQHNVVVGDDVSIGDDCVIKSCAVVGENGFGFERDGDGIPVRLVHLGGVRIGNNVEVGSLTTVCRGTLGDTIIERDVKIDDHVHIAHNVRLRRGAMVIACAEISGGVDVGEYAWVGPNSSVIQQLKIGPHALIGIGANVIREVEEGVTVAGNPAKPFSRK